MINIAVIGAGNWGKNLVRNFSRVPGAKLHTICDVDEKIRDAMSKLYPDAKLATDLESVLADDAVDAVVILSQDTRPYEMGSASIKAGKHTYIEKPITLKSGHAKKLCDLAQKKNVKLMVGHLLVYHPAVQKLKELIEGGELGDIYCIYTERVNLGIVRSNENAWWSLAPHDISVILELLGDVPDSIVARGEDYLQKGIEDIVFANLDFAGKKMAQIHVSWLDPHKSRKMTIVGSKKMAVFDDMEPNEKIKIYDKGAEPRGYVSYNEAISVRTGEIVVPEIDMVEPLEVECRHFVDCIANNKQPASGGLEGLRVTEILEAGQRSLDKGGIPIKLGT